MALDSLDRSILAALPGKGAQVAGSLGRARNDGTVRRRLAALAEAGEVEREDGVWRRCQDGCQDAPELPDPPDGLPGYEYPAGWDEGACDQFVQQAEWLTDKVGALEGLDVDLLERYVTALQRARIAQSSLDDEGLLTSSANGRKFTHPAVAIVREAERDAHVYMEAMRKRAGAGKGGGGADSDDPFNLSQ